MKKTKPSFAHFRKHFFPDIGTEGENVAGDSDGIKTKQERLQALTGEIVKRVIFLIVIVVPSLCFAAPGADFVLVKKSKAKLYLLHKGDVFMTFDVVFGANPVGHKKEKGDRRTPEGLYVLEKKNENSAFYRSIRISYPNEEDIARARRMGVNPGGNIMIHGQRNGDGHLAPIMQQYNWTEGCIAVTNQEMDVIWGAVKEGTPIVIMP